MSLSWWPGWSGYISQASPTGRRLKRPSRRGEVRLALEELEDLTLLSPAALVPLAVIPAPAPVAHQGITQAPAAVAPKGVTQAPVVAETEKAVQKPKAVSEVVGPAGKNGNAAGKDAQDSQGNDNSLVGKAAKVAQKANEDTADLVGKAAKVAQKANEDTADLVGKAAKVAQKVNEDTADLLEGGKKAGGKAKGSQDPSSDGNSLLSGQLSDSLDNVVAAGKSLTSTVGQAAGDLKKVANKLDKVLAAGDFTLGTADQALGNLAGTAGKPSAGTGQGLLGSLAATAGNASEVLDGLLPGKGGENLLDTGSTPGAPGVGAPEGVSGALVPSGQANSQDLTSPATSVGLTALAGVGSSLDGVVPASLGVIPASSGVGLDTLAGFSPNGLGQFASQVAAATGEVLLNLGSGGRGNPGGSGGAAASAGPSGEVIPGLGGPAGSGGGGSSAALLPAGVGPSTALGKGGGGTQADEDPEPVWRQLLNPELYKHLFGDDEEVSPEAMAPSGPLSPEQALTGQSAASLPAQVNSFGTLLQVAVLNDQGLGNASFGPAFNSFAATGATGTDPLSLGQVFQRLAEASSGNSLSRLSGGANEDSPVEGQAAGVDGPGASETADLAILLADLGEQGVSRLPELSSGAETQSAFSSADGLAAIDSLFARLSLADSVTRATNVVDRTSAHWAWVATVGGFVVREVWTRAGRDRRVRREDSRPRISDRE